MRLVVQGPRPDEAPEAAARAGVVDFGVREPGAELRGQGSPGAVQEFRRGKSPLISVSLVLAAPLC